MVLVARVRINIKRHLPMARLTCSCICLVVTCLVLSPCNQEWPGHFVLFAKSVTVEEVQEREGIKDQEGQVKVAGERREEQVKWKLSDADDSDKLRDDADEAYSKAESAGASHLNWLRIFLSQLEGSFRVLLAWADCCTGRLLLLHRCDETLQDLPLRETAAQLRLNPQLSLNIEHSS